MYPTRPNDLNEYGYTSESDTDVIIQTPECTFAFRYYESPETLAEPRPSRTILFSGAIDDYTYGDGSGAESIGEAYEETITPPTAPRSGYEADVEDNYGTIVQGYCSETGINNEYPGRPSGEEGDGDGIDNENALNRGPEDEDVVRTHIEADTRNNEDTEENMNETVMDLSTQIWLRQELNSIRSGLTSLLEERDDTYREFDRFLCFDQAPLLHPAARRSTERLISRLVVFPLESIEDQSKIAQAEIGNVRNQANSEEGSVPRLMADIADLEKTASLLQSAVSLQLDAVYSYLDWHSAAAAERCD